MDAYRQGLETGRAKEREWRQRAEAAQVGHLERQIRTLREELDAKNRRFNVDGDQTVTVDGYGYSWSGPGTLDVGDRVILPENYVSALRYGSGPFLGTVTELGTTYTGTLSRIISRAPPTLGRPETTSPSHRHPNQPAEAGV
ncbi:hypothetical protein [Streptomyces sp. SID14515]|uniref:hypothetical protein n=1 Tax=Streptomyces sp. SID14515 TaxID=2706074 RepID=UPI0013C6E1E8|nr:hypothetical protein [Streptomyces sp. SID14515]NEB39499.1 hypothetical protein [Streptomyces sp. SID14515]